jgi:hypothetical protein
MKHFDLDSLIRVVQEKKMNNTPSKGRNQWEFLKKFDGKSLGSFVEAAKVKTRNSSTGIFQEGNWWNREIDWNVERGNIAIRKPK